MITNTTQTSKRAKKSFVVTPKVLTEAFLDVCLAPNSNSNVDTHEESDIAAERLDYLLTAVYPTLIAAVERLVVEVERRNLHLSGGALLAATALSPTYSHSCSSRKMQHDHMPIEFLPVQWLAQELYRSNINSFPQPSEPYLLSGLAKLYADSLANVAIKMRKDAGTASELRKIRRIQAAKRKADAEAEAAMRAKSHAERESKRREILLVVSLIIQCAQGLCDTEFSKTIFGLNETMAMLRRFGLEWPEMSKASRLNAIIHEIMVRVRKESISNPSADAAMVMVDKLFELSVPDFELVVGSILLWLKVATKVLEKKRSSLGAKTRSGAYGGMKNAVDGGGTETFEIDNETESLSLAVRAALAEFFCATQPDEAEKSADTAKVIESGKVEVPTELLAALPEPKSINQLASSESKFLGVLRSLAKDALVEDSPIRMELLDIAEQATLRVQEFERQLAIPLSVMSPFSDGNEICEKTGSENDAQKGVDAEEEKEARDKILKELKSQRYTAIKTFLTSVHDFENRLPALSDLNYILGQAAISADEEIASALNCCRWRIPIVSYRTSTLDSIDAGVEHIVETLNPILFDLFREDLGKKAFVNFCVALETGFELWKSTIKKKSTALENANFTVPVYAAIPESLRQICDVALHVLSNTCCDSLGNGTSLRRVHVALIENLHSNVPGPLRIVASTEVSAVGRELLGTAPHSVTNNPNSKNDDPFIPVLENADTGAIDKYIQVGENIYSNENPKDGDKAGTAIKVEDYTGIGFAADVPVESTDGTNTVLGLVHIDAITPLSFAALTSDYTTTCNLDSFGEDTKSAPSLETKDIENENAASKIQRRDSMLQIVLEKAAATVAKRTWLLERITKTLSVAEGSLSYVQEQAHAQVKIYLVEGGVIYAAESISGSGDSSSSASSKGSRLLAAGKYKFTQVSRGANSEHLYKCLDTGSNVLHGKNAVLPIFVDRPDSALPTHGEIRGGGTVTALMVITAAEGESGSEGENITAEDMEDISKVTKALGKIITKTRKPKRRGKGSSMQLENGGNEEGAGTKEGSSKSQSKSGINQLQSGAKKGSPSASDAENADDGSDQEDDSQFHMLFAKFMLDDLRNALKNIDAGSIAELKSYKNPPITIHKVLKCLLYLFGRQPKQVKSWPDTAKQISMEILKKMISYDYTAVQKKIIFERIRKIVRSIPRGDVRKKGSLPALTIFSWILITLDLREKHLAAKRRMHSGSSSPEPRSEDEADDADEEDADD